jgi:HSP20 family protein
MASVIRWTPFEDVVSLREAMDRLFEDSFVRPSRSTASNGGTAVERLPIDLYETEEELVLKARLPGVNPEDVEITVHESELTIQAELRSDAVRDEATNWNWYRHELYHGRVGRRINLPSMIQADKAEATFHNGELRLVLPKAEEAKPHNIKVKSAE